MNTAMLGTTILGMAGLLGAFGDLPVLSGGSTAAMAVLQLWIIAQLNPIKDRLAELNVKVAVMEQRCEDAERCRNPTRNGG